MSPSVRMRNEAGVLFCGQCMLEWSRTSGVREGRGWADGHGLRLPRLQPDYFCTIACLLLEFGGLLFFFLSGLCLAPQIVQICRPATGKG